MHTYVNLNKINPVLDELELGSRQLCAVDKALDYIRKRDGEDVMLEIYAGSDYDGLFSIMYETDVFGMMIEILNEEKKVTVSGCENGNILTMTTFGTMEYLLECADTLRKIITYDL